MYSVKEIAEAILSIKSMTHKKLQKLLYYVYAWYYVVFDNKLCDAEFEAWIHGPVSPELYHIYKSYGWSSIDKYIGNINVSENKLSFIKDIIDIYGDLDATKLEMLTHSEQPWLNARNGLSKFEYSDNIIKDSDIKSYYLNHDEDIYDILKSKYSI